VRDKVILGLGFGDEGKGRVVDWLASKAEAVPRVVRFSGAHQAAHHVVHSDKLDHIFAHFGSGTLRGASTFWSHFCAVAPVALMNEYTILREKGVQPLLAIDPRCPLTTPYELAWNKNDSRVKSHGSCGVGIYATRLREEKGFHILFEDIYHPQILKQKMKLLDGWGPFDGLRVDPRDVDFFLHRCNQLADLSGIRLEESLQEFTTWPIVPSGIELIFEGSQGLLLDQSYGFFPHVTPSNTGTQNIRALVPRTDLDIWLVTRAYATRHGNGPFVPFENGNHPLVKLKPNPWEQNGDTGMQGKFKVAPISLDHLRYAVKKDEYLRAVGDRTTLVVTCVDQLDDEFIATQGGQIVWYKTKQDLIHAIQAAVGSKTVLCSKSALGDDPLYNAHDV